MPRTSTGRAAALSAWLVWWGLAVVISVYAVRKGPAHSSVLGAYRQAAENWPRGLDLYDLRGIHGFLYLPQAAVLMVPLTLLSDTASEVVWRCLNILVMALAMGRLAPVVTPAGPGRFSRAGYFLLLTVLTALAAVGNANHGQMNLMMAAMMVSVL